MKLFGKDLRDNCLLIAEIGVNHEGDVQRARELIFQAHEAGADAVKLQSYSPERYASNYDLQRLARVTKFALSYEDHIALFEFAKKINCHLFSTPLTEDWVAHLDPFVTAFKVASGDLTFEPVIRACARTGKPLIISTGAATMNEISQAVKWVRDEMEREELKNRLVLLHCVAAYPTPVQDANVRIIQQLKNNFNLEIGYSNHVMGVSACLAAVAVGASVIEVHFTDSRQGREFKDHALSVEPKEFENLKKSIDEVRAALGVADKKVLDCEKSGVPLMRKGLIAWRNLGEGETLTAADIAYARPSIYLKSGELNRVVGKKMRRSVKKGDLLGPEDLFLDL